MNVSTGEIDPLKPADRANLPRPHTHPQRWGVGIWGLRSPLERGLHPNPLLFLLLDPAGVLETGRSSAGSGHTHRQSARIPARSARHGAKSTPPGQIPANWGKSLYGP